MIIIVYMIASMVLHLLPLKFGAYSVVLTHFGTRESLVVNLQLKYRNSIQCRRLNAAIGTTAFNFGAAALSLLFSAFIKAIAAPPTQHWRYGALFRFGKKSALFKQIRRLTRARPGAVIRPFPQVFRR